MSIEITVQVTDWAWIRSRGGSNPLFPGRRVYAFGSTTLWRGPEWEWFKVFKRQATEQRMDVEVQENIVYLVWDA